MADETWDEDGTPRRLRRKLRNLRLSRVDLVPVGANEHAHIALAKRQETEPEGGAEPMLKSAENLFAKSEDLFAKSADKALPMEARTKAHREAVRLKHEARNAQPQRPDPVGILLRKARKDRELGQSKVAEAAGITQAALSKIESGKTATPTLETFSALYSVLGLTYDEVKRAGILR